MDESSKLKDIIWNTNEKDIAVVSLNTGLTKAVVKAGSAGTDVIYIKLEKKILTCKIVVKEKKERKLENPEDSAAEEVAYLVKKKDTLWKIAKEYKTTVKKMRTETGF